LKRYLTTARNITYIQVTLYGLPTLPQFKRLRSRSYLSRKSRLRRSSPRLISLFRQLKGSRNPTPFVVELVKPSPKINPQT
jgi:hypothetical protein